MSLYYSVYFCIYLKLPKLLFVDKTWNKVSLSNRKFYQNGNQKILDLGDILMVTKSHPSPNDSFPRLLRGDHQPWGLSFYLFIYYWRIIALQNFAVFCQTSTWISHSPGVFQTLEKSLPPMAIHSILCLLQLLKSSHSG